jgi:drug/metabolite transporter (DMT)-like permease
VISLDRRTIGLLCGLAAAVTWAGGAIVSRYLVTTRFSAIDLTLLRYLGCFPIALLAVAFDRKRSMPDISWGRLAVLIALAGPS